MDGNDITPCMFDYASRCRQILWLPQEATTFVHRHVRRKSHTHILMSQNTLFECRVKVGVHVIITMKNVNPFTSSAGNAGIEICTCSHIPRLTIKCYATFPIQVGHFLGIVMARAIIHDFYLSFRIIGRGGKNTLDRAAKRLGAVEGWNHYRPKRPVHGFPLCWLTNATGRWLPYDGLALDSSIWRSECGFLQTLC